MATYSSPVVPVTGGGPTTERENERDATDAGGHLQGFQRFRVAVDDEETGSQEARHEALERFQFFAASVAPRMPGQLTT